MFAGSSTSRNALGRGAYMLGWSICIKNDNETVLYAQSTDCGLDQKVRDQADQILDSADYPEWGYGYPNRYHVRNDKLPRAGLYRHKTIPGTSPLRYEREEIELGMLSDIPGDKILWVELWDQS